MKLLTTLLAIGLASSTLAVPLPQGDAVSQGYTGPDAPSETGSAANFEGSGEDDSRVERRANKFKFPPHEARPKIDPRPDKRDEDSFEARAHQPATPSDWDFSGNSAPPHSGGDGGHWAHDEGAGTMPHKRGWGGNQGPPPGYGNGGEQGGTQGPPHRIGQGFPQAGGQGFPQGAPQGAPQAGGQGSAQGWTSPTGGNQGWNSGASQPSGPLQGMGEVNQGASGSDSGTGGSSPSGGSSSAPTGDSPSS